MTRYILTTATLAAFFASNLTAAAPERAIRELRSRRSDISAAHAQTPSILGIGQHLVAVDISAATAPEGMLDVALQFETDALPPATIAVWAGLKNGWGSPIGRAAPAYGLAGFYRARIGLPDELAPSARLWIGLDRDGRRPAVGSVALPS